MMLDRPFRQGVDLRPFKSLNGINFDEIKCPRGGLYLSGAIYHWDLVGTEPTMRSIHSQGLRA